MFADAGGHVVPGGDTNASKIPGLNIHHEILAISEAGMTPMQIIQSATKWAAQMIEKDKDLGTVEAGKLADVIVLTGDPLQSIDNLRKVETVIFDGRQVETGNPPLVYGSVPARFRFQSAGERSAMGGGVQADDVRR